MLPVVKGFPVANTTSPSIPAFMGADLMLFLGGYAGYKYLVVATAVSVWWLGMALSGHKAAVDGSLGAQAVHILHRYHYLPQRNDVGGLPAGRSAGISEHAALTLELTCSPSSSSSSPA